MIRGLSAGFNIATRAMQSSQYAVTLHMQNISNASDPGYTRRTLENPVDPTGKLPYVSRLRNFFIDEQYRHATANAGDAQTRREIMNRVEDIFGDPLNSGLGLSIDRFFDSFKAVSEDPADIVLRQEALEGGRQLAQHVHEAMQQLTVIKSQIDEQMKSVVVEINGHLQTVKDLNGRIAALKNSAEPDVELQDQRDKILDELARLTGAVPTYLENGTVRVMIGSMPAVDGLVVKQMELVETDAGIFPGWQGIALPGYSGHGVLPALQKIRDRDITDVMQTVDKLAKDIARAVNEVHRKGFDMAGNPGQDFFLIQDDVPGGIHLHPDMTPEKLAAASTSPALAADGTVADAIYRLSEGLELLNDTPPTPDRKTSPKSLYRNLVGLIGSKGKAAQQDEAVAVAHTRISQEQRSSQWGVSIDEEWAMLQAQVKSFSAVARVMNVMDQMLDELINTAR